MAIFSSGGSGPVIWQIFSSLLLNHPLDAVTLGERKKNLLPKQKGQKIFQKFCTVFWGALEHFNRSKEVVGIDLWQWICDKPWPAAAESFFFYFWLRKAFSQWEKNWNFHDKTNFFVENINHGIKFAGKKFENFIFSVKKNRKKDCEKIVRNPRKNISKNQKSRLKIARKICWSSLQMG